MFHIEIVRGPQSNLKSKLWTPPALKSMNTDRASFFFLDCFINIIIYNKSIQCTLVETLVETFNVS